MVSPKWGITFPFYFSLLPLKYFLISIVVLINFLFVCFYIGSHHLFFIALPIIFTLKERRPFEITYKASKKLIAKIKQRWVRVISSHRSIGKMFIYVLSFSFQVHQYNFCRIYILHFYFLSKSTLLSIIFWGIFILFVFFIRAPNS